MKHALLILLLLSACDGEGWGDRGECHDGIRLNLSVRNGIETADTWSVILTAHNPTLLPATAEILCGFEDPLSIPYEVNLAANEHASLGLTFVRRTGGPKRRLSCDLSLGAGLSAEPTP